VVEIIGLEGEEVPVQVHPQDILKQLVEGLEVLLLVEVMGHIVLMQLQREKILEVVEVDKVPVS
jgi:hypothetical protein